MDMPKIDIQFGDCIPGIAEHCPDESCDCLITSIPFGALFSYSHKTEDIGNNQDGIELHEGQFALHMRFAIEQFYRVLRPGSVACIHIQQLLMYKIQHGYMGMRDFRGAVITMFKNHGFQAHGEVAIPKNPQAVATRLKLHSLMFITGKKDSRRLAPAMNDYILFFKKPGDGEPVRGIYDKDINPGGWFTTEDWIKWANGSWSDILEIDTLEGWRCAKESQEEKHVCPLQLEPVRRCIKIYTKPGDIVLEPFCGIGTVPYVCVEQGRGCVAFELKESYYRMSVANIKKAQSKDPQQKIFN